MSAQRQRDTPALSKTGDIAGTALVLTYFKHGYIK